MENRFKHRISRMFRSSFGLCRTRNISDVIQNRQNFSICRPKCPETIANSTCCTDTTAPRRKVSEQYSPFALTSSNGRMCPPASPVSPSYYDCKEKREKKHHSVKNKKKIRTHLRKNSRSRDSGASCIYSSSSQENFRAWSWFSTDDDDDRKEDETETLFSWKSLSSDSSDLFLRGHRSRRRKNGTRRGFRSRDYSSKCGSDVLPLSAGGKNNNNNNKVKDSFAVVKSSSDPYNDFRTSMVEMILEKQLFAAKDLEQLLRCFLSLNSHHHHRIIVEVFLEISEALFSNWSIDKS